MLDGNVDFTKIAEKYNLMRFNCCVYYNDKICVVDVSSRYYTDLIIFESIPDFNINNTSNYRPHQPYSPLDWIADVSTFTMLDKKLDELLNIGVK